MAFRFSLHSLLRMWHSRERYERRKLEALAARLGALRAEMRRVEGNALASRREIGARLDAGVTASELHFAETCEENRHAFLAWLEKQVKKTETEHQAQMAVYQAVGRQCKIFENLRRRQLEAFRLEETRREQKRLDEIFLLSRASAERAENENADKPGRVHSDRQFRRRILPP